MKRLTKVVGGAVLGLASGMMFSADATGSNSPSVWLCRSHINQSGGYDHNDGMGGVWVESPDGKHVDWGSKACYASHTAVIAGS